jgi:hypothetical protein
MKKEWLQVADKHGGFFGSRKKGEVEGAEICRVRGTGCPEGHLPVFFHAGFYWVGGMRGTG